MTTALDIVTDAAFAAGVQGQDEGISNSDAQLILRRLGRLLDSWSNDNQLVYDVYIDTLSLLTGTTSYLTSLLANGRPVSINSIYTRQNTTDLPVDLVSNQTYGDLPYKAGTGIPFACYYNSGVPDGTLNFYPTPSLNLTAYVSCLRNLRPAAMTLASVLAYPPGYERMLVDQLAVDICPSFGLEASQTLLFSAKQSKGLLQRANYIPLEMRINRTIHTNIISGP